MTTEIKSLHWFYHGLLFGAIMFIGMAIVIPLSEGESLSGGRLAKILVFVLISGMVYGYFGYGFDWNKILKRKQE